MTNNNILSKVEVTDENGKKVEPVWCKNCGGLKYLCGCIPRVQCPTCKGKGSYPMPAGEMETCWMCNGKKYVDEGVPVGDLVDAKEREANLTRLVCPKCKGNIFGLTTTYQESSESLEQWVVLHCDACKHSIEILQKFDTVPVDQEDDY